MLTIDKVLLAQLRKARDVWFHGTSPADGFGPGKATMSFRLESVFDKPYDSVPTTRVGLPIYGMPKGSKLFASIGYASACDQTWHAVVCHVLRPGDQIALDVFPDAHRNQYMKAAQGSGRDPDTGKESDSLRYDGLHADVLRLRVERKGKRFMFEIDHGLCPDNSARMVVMS